MKSRDLKNNRNYQDIETGIVYLYYNKQFISMNPDTGSIEIYSLDDLKPRLDKLQEDTFILEDNDN